jgi:hypothetical protein
LIGNRNLSELVIGVRVYRGSDIDSDHFFTLDELRFSPKWLHLSRNSALKENVLHCIIRLVIDEKTKNATKSTRNSSKLPYYFGMENIKKPYSHTQQMHIWENTKDSYIRKIKIMGFSPAITRFQCPGLTHAAPACGLCAGDRRTHTACTRVVRHVGYLMADLP